MHSPITTRTFYKSLQPWEVNTLHNMELPILQSEKQALKALAPVPLKHIKPTVLHRELKAGLSRDRHKSHFMLITDQVRHLDEALPYCQFELYCTAYGMRLHDLKDYVDDRDHRKLAYYVVPIFKADAHRWLVYTDTLVSGFKLFAPEELVVESAN